MAEPYRIAVVGCGAVSRKYFPTLTALPGIEVTVVADVVAERAAEAAAELPGVRASTPAEAFAAADVDIVVNLTVPVAHAEVALAALAAGKHVYGEKPLAASLAAGREVLGAADAAGLRVGCAPDTVLGTGIQTARRVLDAGDIGTPYAACAFFGSAGPDTFHPRPQSFYRPGAGPLFDMGPYYLSSLVTLLGPIRRVTGLGRRARTQRPVGSGPAEGTVIDVQVDTHVTAVLEHASGELSTMVTSWDLPGGWTLPRIEVYGSEGSLSAPNPNVFGGPVAVRRPGGDWDPVEPRAGYPDVARGVGVADLALALRLGRPHSASAELALHVLDAMEAILAAAKTGVAVELNTTCARPPAVPLTGHDGFAR